MKIIKSGKSEKKTRKFICKTCKCEFLCEEGEYWIEPQVKHGENSMTYTATRTYMTCCPECHKIVEDSEFEPCLTYYTNTQQHTNKN